MKKITFILLFILSVNLAFAQPANDEPGAAIVLTVGTDFADQAITADNILATASEAIPEPGCANYAGGDVWFTITVPASGAVTVETNSDASTLTDTGMAVYSGAVGALVLEECDDDDSADGLFSLISLTGRTPGETLFIRVWEWGGGTEDTFQISAWDAPVLPPPANDDPAGAIALTIGTDFAGNAIVATNESATASEVADASIPAPGCANYLGGDVWFSVVVPADGNVTIETNSDASTLTDSGMAVYSGAIGAFVLEECDDDDSDDGLFSLISLTGRTPGETLYIRVWEWGGNLEDTFQVSAWNPVLSSDDFSIKGFSYYPNPVKDILTMEAPSTISNAVVYSVSGQEIMRISSSGDNQMPLDMSGLSRGVYFVKVTVDDKTDTFKVLKE